MAIQWGSWSGGSGVGGHRVGIDLEINGVTITAHYYVQTGSNSIADTQTLTRTGALTGTYSYSFSASGTPPLQKYIGSWAMNGSRGSSYTFGASISGVYSGATPSVSLSVTIPALPPSAPVAPTISNITTSSLRLNLASAPATNGAAIIRYEWQLEGGSVVVGTTTRNQTISGLSANTTYRGYVRAVNSAGAGAGSPWSAYATTAQSPVSAPTALTITRVSDTSQTASWTRNATTGAPYTSQQLQRRTYTNGVASSWATVGTISTTRTNSGTETLSDTSTVANREYDYRVVAFNTGSPNGVAGGTSARVRTTPAEPTGLGAVKSGANINVTGTPQHTAGSATYEWQDNPNGGGWVNVAGTTTSPDRLFTGVDPTQTHSYRSRASVTSGTVNSTTLYSTWSAASPTVQLQAPPLAPTLVSPSESVSNSGNVTFTWRHNPVDTTAQRAAEIRYRVNGGAWVTGSTTTAQTWTTGALAGLCGSVDWQVRTKGQYTTSPTDDEFGPRSAVSTFQLSSTPTATISSPSVTYPTSVTVLTWAYFSTCGSAQTNWEAQLWDDDTNLQMGSTRTGTTQTSTTFSAANQILSTGQQYRVRVRVRSAAGLWSSWTQRIFTTDFPLPPAVDAMPEFDCVTGFVNVSTNCPGPEVDHIVIQRLHDEGWVDLSGELECGSSIMDRLVPVGGESCWRVLSFTSIGAVREGTPACLTFRDATRGACSGNEIPVMEAYLSAGPAYGRVIQLAADLQINEPEFGRSQVSLVKFAGDLYPLEYAGSGMVQSLEVSFTTGPPGNDVECSCGGGIVTLEEVRRFVSSAMGGGFDGPRFWRDYEGRAFPVSVAPVAVEQLGKGWHHVTLSLTRVQEWS